jgi:4'-phosphopantetheinyl transferase EntD
MISFPSLPPDIHHFFTTERHDSSVLSDSEREASKKFGEKRLADFSTGRYCLRQSTAPIGFSGEVLIGEKGMPMLPANITASVSHSNHLCGAIAARKDQYLSVGLDIETRDRVHKPMWHLLFTDEEMQMLESMSAEKQSYLTTVFFSLKEAYYKLQYPLTNTFLHFHDVEIFSKGDEFYIKTITPTSLFSSGHLIKGHVLQFENDIITYCLLPR